MIKFIIYSIIIFLLILVFISIILRINLNKYVTDKYNLEKNGFMVLDNILSDKQINEFTKLIKQKKFKLIKNKIINSKFINNIIKKNLNDDYKFMDYIFTIIKSNFHTCHRDYNGIFYNKGQKYNSYTIIFYLEDMDSCLDVLSGSHKKKNIINLTDLSKKIKCKPGSAILFDANLIHSGSFNKKPNNMRIQMKITHKDDFNVINYYQNYNRYLEKENKLPLIIQKIQKHITCQFPILSDLAIDKNIRKNINRKSNPLSKKIYSFLTKGDINYYNLPDAK